MATVSYLSGGEQYTAALMNSLWGEFESKLSTLLAGGKSFFLARDVEVPQALLGKVFYIISGDAAHCIYSPRAPGPKSAGVPIPYDHTDYTDAVDAIDPDDVGLVWDDTNRIVTVTRIGLPGDDLWVGYWDGSLQAHTIDHAPTEGADPVPYFIRDGDGAIPEKRYKFALAEILIEGPDTTVDLPVTWDKYSCFRIHNLAWHSTTVTFGTAHSVTLSPFECRTVRRDSPTTNYRSSLHYSFAFEAGDPRFFWFLPTKVEIVGATETALIGTGPRVANTMQANNLTNPGLIYEWSNWLAITKDTLFDGGQGGGVVQDPGAEGTRRFAWFLRDESIVCDVRPLNAAAFGDPSNAATLLGDLIHHKGQIIILRRSKEPDPETEETVITEDAVTFAGYATIVADFAAHDLEVTENVDGDLQIENIDVDNNVDLIPVGTNLFKSWVDPYESHPTVIPLNDAAGDSTPFTIETAIFETPPSGAEDFNLQASAPWSVYQRTMSAAANERDYVDIDPTDLGAGYFTTTATGPDTETTAIEPEPAAQRVLHGIHALTVADILDLSWWGDKDLADQATAYVTFTDKSLTLTPEGLVLIFTETIQDIQPAALDASRDLRYWRAGLFARKRVIRFRGHGWGYNSPNHGVQCWAYQVPRYGLMTLPNDYSQEDYGPNGEDFTARGTGQTESTFKTLHRTQTTELDLDDNTFRFWKAHGHAMLVFLANYQTAGWYETNRAALIAGTITLGDELRSLPMLPEHYNGLAQAVNQLTAGGMLNGYALLWRNPDTGNAVGLGPTYEAIPTPVDCYAAFSSQVLDGAVDPWSGGSAGPGGPAFNTANRDTWDLYDFLGITIKTAEDFSDDLTTFSNEVSIAGLARFDVTNTDSACSISGQALPVWEHQAATGSGAGYQGTFTPSSVPTMAGDSNGDYYVCSASGWDGSQWWIKGEIILKSDAGVGRISAHLMGPSFAYFRQISQFGTATDPIVVQLHPDSVGNIGSGHVPPVMAVNGLGNWTKGPLLPFGTFDRGDFYDVVGTSTDPYLAGSRIIWDGTEWKSATHSYCDFNWVSISSVKTWFEANGFLFDHRELFTPLTLGRVECNTAETSSNSSLSGTASVTDGGFTVGSYIAPGTHQILRTDPAAPGSRIQFSTVASGATWKLKLNPWDWIDADSLADNTFASIGDLKQWEVSEDESDRPRALINLNVDDYTDPSIICADCAVTFVDCGEYVKTPVYQDGEWLYSTLATNVTHSTGLTPSGHIKLSPIGMWAWDGETWKMNRDQHVRQILYTVRPPVHSDAAGTFQTVTPGAGTAYLTAAAGSALMVMPFWPENLIEL